MQSAHQLSLAAKHADLDHRIEDELHRPKPDDLIVADLKRQKLRVKEEMHPG